MKSIETIIPAIVLGASLALSLATPAMADDVEATTEYIFDDHLVQSEIVKQDGELIKGRTPGKVSSLIRVRKHFIGEMLSAVQDI